jgi:hypothetical protein
MDVELALRIVDDRWASEEERVAANLLQRRFPKLDAREVGLIVYAVLLKQMFGPNGAPFREPL